MSIGQLDQRRVSEDRLDALREEARRTGRVADRGVTTVGGPIPREAAAVPGYYGLPIVKAPVWTWQIGLYLFVGGTAGMSAMLALVGVLTSPFEFARALGVGFAGAVISPCLLIADSGRPARFFNMLRVFKWRSAMSVGVWTLVLFSAFVGSALLMAESLGVLTKWVFPALQSAASFLRPVRRCRAPSRHLYGCLAGRDSRSRVGGAPQAAAIPLRGRRARVCGGRA